MDVCIILRLAVANTRKLFTISSILLLFLAPVLSANTLNAKRDYILPGESRGGFISQPSTTKSGNANKQEQTTVNYQSFDGASHVLVSHAGRFVNVLLPANSTEAMPFTKDHIEELVDRLDILYSTYRELMQAEPAGAGLLNVAFINKTCGKACGYIGFKGIEVSQDTDNYKNLMIDLDSGKLDTILIHEMAHNFDLYASYLHYLPDHAHAWTDIFEFFTPYRFGREGNKFQSADILYHSPSSFVWKPYLADNSANWEMCVRDQMCNAKGFDANNLWAMMYYRIEALHGTEAVLNSFSYLQDYTRSNSPPKTEAEKEDLRLMSLAVGSRTNISCYLEKMKWSTSQKLKNDMQARFGSGGEFCKDEDKDGYSVLEGDCDDHNSLRGPGQPEILGNQVDDDCDQIQDEITQFESSAMDIPEFSAAMTKRALPLELNGSLSSLQDRDAVRFALPANGLVDVTLCVEEGFTGWVSGLQENGQFLDSDLWFTYLASTGCNSKTFDFAGLPSGHLEVLADTSVGKYSLTVSKTQGVTSDFSDLLLVEPNSSGGMNLVVSDTDGILSKMGSDELEICISGQGIKLRTPFSTRTSVALNASSAPGLKSGNNYQARVRPMKHGRPLAGYSAGHLFQYDAISKTPIQLDDGFSGAWFDPSHNGEGFVIEIINSSQAVVYWFTYSQKKKQRWMIGIGKLRGNIIVIDELLSSKGGRFGDDFDPSDVTFDVLGSLKIAFLDCNTAILNYSVDQRGDHQSLQRLSGVQDHKCGSSSVPSGVDISGSWFDPTHSGEGFIVQQLTRDMAMMFWFSYNSSGDQAWMFNTGSINNGHLKFSQVIQTSGGGFGRSFDPSTIQQGVWGQLEMQLDCDHGSVSYVSSKSGFSNGRQNLVPLTRLKNSGCAR